MKNEIPGFHPGSFVDALGRSQASKNMILDEFKAPGKSENEETLKNTTIGIQNEEI